MWPITAETWVHFSSTNTTNCNGSGARFLSSRPGFVAAGVLQLGQAF